jgi:hypothetical protein
MADGIKIGNLDISTFKVGSSDCKVYLGDALLYPNVKATVVAKFNVTDTSNPTQIIGQYASSPFSEIEIDGAVQTAVTSAYTFSTTGEHTVKYELASATTIGNNSFRNCSGLTSIEIPDSVTTIGNYVFYYCTSLTSIDIPNSVTSIDYSAFSRCGGLTSCTIGSSVTSIGNGAFDYCSGLTSINIPDSVTSIGESVFEGCSGLTSIDLPSGVTSIGSYTFQYCYSLTSCTIGSGVTSIGTNAFYNCRSLTSIDIPSGVTSIGSYAFAYCNSLISIVSNATTAPTIQSTTLRNVHTSGTLTVPSDSSGYDIWMQNANYYLGLYNWTKVEQ